MPTTLTVAPQTEPLSLDEAKLHLRVDGTDDDTLIASLITAAREFAEMYTRRVLVTQTWVHYLDKFPVYSPSGQDLYSNSRDERLPNFAAIEIPKPPLQSVSSLKYIDTGGILQTLVANTDYAVDAVTEPGRIVPAYGKYWPVTRLVPNAVQVTFVAGYGGASAVPVGIKQALLLLIGHWYENRETVVVDNRVAVQDLPLAVDALLSANRILSF